MPGFSAGMANVSRDEQRHIGFGVKVLSELLGRGAPRPARRTGPRWSSCCAKSCPTAPPSSRRRTSTARTPSATASSLEDIYAFGLKLIRQRWRTIGFPTEEMPPGVFPFDPEDAEREVAARQVKMMMAGILGPPDGPTPDASPELQRLYFDLITRVADPAAANGSPLVYQWRFSDAEPWHLIIDNGSTRAEPGEAPNPNAGDRVELGRLGRLRQTRRQPAEDGPQRRIRPRGSLREMARMRKVFPS